MRRDVEEAAENLLPPRVVDHRQHVSLDVGVRLLLLLPLLTTMADADYFIVHTFVYIPLVLVLVLVLTLQAVIFPGLLQGKGSGFRV